MDINLVAPCFWQFSHKRHDVMTSKFNFRFWTLLYFLSILQCNLATFHNTNNDRSIVSPFAKMAHESPVRKQNELRKASVNSISGYDSRIERAASNAVNNRKLFRHDEIDVDVSDASTTPISLSSTDGENENNSLIDNINNNNRKDQSVASSLSTEQKTISDPVRRRRRHRRDSSASVTTPSNCLPECGMIADVADEAQPAPFGGHHHNRQDYLRDGPSTPPNSIDSPIEIVELDANRQTEEKLRHSSTDDVVAAAEALLANSGINRTANSSNATVAKEATVLNVDNDRIIVIADETLDVSADEENGSHNDVYVNDEAPKTLPLRPIIHVPYGDDADEEDPAVEVSTVYTEQHAEVKLNCEVDLDIAAVVWMRNGQLVHTIERNSQPGYRFVREARGTLVITNAMLEDDGKWQCEAENSKGYIENGRLLQLVVLDRPKPPYLLIDSRRLDAGNIFVPVKENSELTLACVTEGGNPKPILTWEVLISPGVDRHSQKLSADVLELQETKNEKAEKEPYKINSGAKSEAKLPAVYRAHHNARILCVMEHPTLKVRQNSSLLLDVQYTPSFAISRTPGFGYPLREGIEVSLKCDVDSNPPSTPIWQKDDGDPPIQQNGDGFLNFTQIRREHSGWYKCTSRHLNFQYSSIGYFLNIRYDSVDVTSEPLEQDMLTGAASQHTTKKNHQLEVQLGGTVTLQCPQGSLGCWSHLDPVNSRLRGLGSGLSTPTGIFSLKDIVYQDAGTYKCVGQSPVNKKKLEVLHTMSLNVKGAPTVSVRNHTPIAYPGSPLHLSVEFCANPPAYAARWLHGDRVYTPGNQYGIDVLAYGVIDLPIPFCKEARLTIVHMHERVQRTFYFIVSSPGGVAEAQFHVNFTLKHRAISNSVDGSEEELRDPEEIQFPNFGSGCCNCNFYSIFKLLIIVLIVNVFCSNVF